MDNSFNLALDKLRESAARMGIGMAECATSLKDLAQASKDIPFFLGETAPKAGYKTLSVNYEARN